MPLIDAYEEKWFAKVRASRSKWLEMVKNAQTLDSYVKGIAAITGLPESEIRASFPAKNYAEFQANAEKFVDLWMTKLEKAHASRKWARNYVNAFRAH